MEDNADDERLTLRALRRNNIMNEVVVACDGEEALDYLFGRGRFEGRDTAALPAVILLDLNLPGMTGIEVLRAIRSNPATRLTPVVVLTNSVDPDQAALCIEHGANSFVRKPSDPQAFSEVILQIGLYWLLLNEPVPSAAQSLV
ncbi:MAG: response regulator [Fimbriimonadales bacterium]|nr:response regulator [Fimbriimonadales bacterium]